jgi:hypothetical protein
MLKIWHVGDVAALECETEVEEDLSNYDAPLRWADGGINSNKQVRESSSQHNSIVLSTLLLTLVCSSFLLMRLTCLYSFSNRSDSELCSEEVSVHAASQGVRCRFPLSFERSQLAMESSPTTLANLQALSIEPSETKLLRLEKQQRTAAAMPNVVEKLSLTQSSSTSKNYTTTKLQMIDWNRIATLSPSNLPYPRYRSSPPLVVGAEQIVCVLHQVEDEVADSFG